MGLTLVLTSWARAEQSELERQVEAALVYKILSFVEIRYLLSKPKLYLCISDSPTAELKALTGKKVGKRSLFVKKLIKPEDLSRCTAILGNESSYFTKAILNLGDKLGAKPLLIFKSHLSCTSNAHAGIYLKNDKFRFDVNNKLAKKQGVYFELGLVKRAVTACQER
jgi:hypothetical protein